MCHRYCYGHEIDVFVLSTDGQIARQPMYVPVHRCHSPPLLDSSHSISVASMNAYRTRNVLLTKMKTTERDKCVLRVTFLNFDGFFYYFKYRFSFTKVCWWWNILSSWIQRCIYQVVSILKYSVSYHDHYHSRISLIIIN